MPELPEVERAARILRTHALRRTIARVEVSHPAYERALPAAAVALLVGRRIVDVERRGKHQLIALDDGSTLAVHFRMTGEWRVGTRADAGEPFARLVLDLDNGARITLADARALGSARRHPPGQLCLPPLGPDPLGPAFTPAHLGTALRGRRTPLKAALLDQRLVAGLGNIYAAEALWLARLDPRRRSSTLTAAERQRLVRAIQHVLRRAPAARYADWRDDDGYRWRVYDREGQRCRRCGHRIARIVQGGRSTYYCPGCQTSKGPRR